MKDCEPVITVRGLTNRFGEQVIHEDLDLTVCRGEIIGVVGGSGTGKSVLMRSIIGLQTPAEGEIEVLGENMVGRNEDEAKNIRRRWGILFQNGALFSTLTVAENVEVPIREYFPYLKPPLLDEIASYKIDLGGGVRRVDRLTPEAARPHCLSDHARSRHALRHLRPRRRDCGSEGDCGRNDSGTIGFGSSLDTRIL